MMQDLEAEATGCIVDWNVAHEVHGSGELVQTAADLGLVQQDLECVVELPLGRQVEQVAAGPAGPLQL